MSANRFVRRDLEVAKQRVAVFELGDGPKVLLLHGYPQDHRCWRRVAPLLAKSHTVVAPDWFGWGASSRSFDLRPTFEDEVARVGALCDALGLSRVDLVAHDYGGLLALGYAVARPQRVSRLALINTRAHLQMAPATLWLWNALTWAARSPVWRPLLHQLPWSWLHRRALRRYVDNGSFTAGELADYVSWMQGAGAKWFVHFCRYFRVDAHPELAQGLQRLDDPIAIIWGDRDPYFPRTIADDLKRLVPAATLTHIADGDHYVIEEHPERVARAILDLLARPAG